MNSTRRLHILYIVQYFNLPHEPGGARPFQFARNWVRMGHRVTVLTSNLNHKTMSETGRSNSVQDVEGIQIIRLQTYNHIRGSLPKRLLNFLSFALAAAFRGLQFRDFDLVYASSTPLTVGIPGHLISSLRRKPFYFEVRDLWPESAVVAGALRSKPVIRMAELLEGRLYRRAARVVAISDGVREGVLRKGKPPQDVLLVPQGVDDWMFEVQPAVPEDLPFDPDRHFICTYLGAHGPWNRLETILESARLLAGTPVRFLFVGDGDSKPRLRRLAVQWGLDNVFFHDPVPKQRIFDYLGQSHLALIHTWDHPFHRMVLANKLFDYMAAGCPIAAGARGEMPRLIEQAGCGWSVPPEEPQALADLIRRVSRMDCGRLKQIGNQGREFVVRHYRRADLAARLADSFLETCTKPAGAGSLQQELGAIK